MQDYEKLRVWQLAHELTLDLYKLTRNFPDEEKYILVKQLRRSSISVSCNLVEGCGRYSERDKLHFFQMSYGSARELRYQIRLAGDLGYIDANSSRDVGQSAMSLEKMLNSLVMTIRRRIENGK